MDFFLIVDKVNEDMLSHRSLAKVLKFLLPPSQKAEPKHLTPISLCAGRGGAYSGLCH